jgi:hypothetical protein
MDKYHKNARYIDCAYTSQLSDINSKHYNGCYACGYSEPQEPHKVYTLYIRNEKELKHAEKVQQKAYNTYNSVQVYPNGIDRIKIICR